VTTVSRLTVTHAIRRNSGQPGLTTISREHELRKSLICQSFFEKHRQILPASNDYLSATVGIWRPYASPCAWAIRANSARVPNLMSDA
jgi:hypothetical protein